MRASTSEGPSPANLFQTHMTTMLLQTASDSMEQLRSRICNVHLSDASIAIDKGVECIEFEMDGFSFQGELRGRMRDVIVGANDESDRSIALSVLLDGDAVLIRRVS